ncbi:MAG: hypothetical protein FJW32_01150 [Acidobacteria bacterium]|nr:hypothetical protein [Acidobacteriota bacterium]
MAQAPAWSPDGSKLAYRQYLSADTAAVIVRESATGTTRQVVRLPVRGTIPSPAFSPDGSRIAYNDNGMLWTILATGGIATSLASDTSGDRPCWSPDGKWIAAIIGGQLTKIPAAGGPSVQLFGPTGGNCLWTNVGIFMMGRSGLERIPESGGQPVTVGLDMHGSIAAATPDGSTISILTVGNQLLSFDSRSAKVTRTVGLQADGLVRGVSVHPDGKRIAGWTQKTLSDLWLLEGFPVPTTGLERLFRKWKDPS